MNGQNLSRLLIIVLLPLSCLAVALAAHQQAQRDDKAVQKDVQKDVQQKPATAEAHPTFEKTVLPFLSENCYMCHNEKLKSGGLNLEAYRTTDSVLKDRLTWEHIHERVSRGEMPPKDMPRPPDADLKKFTSWIETEFDRADNQAGPNPGRVTARRLNRAEYNNTVRDLLGVNTHPADDFPQDDSGYGFDNIGDVLSVSPVLMEKYLSAAEQVARQAVYGSEASKPTLVKRRSQGRKIEDSDKPLTEYDATGLSLANAFHTNHRFPADGEYTFRAYLGGVRPAGSEPLQMALWIDGKQVQVVAFDADKVASFSDDRQDFGGMAQDFRAKVTAGDHWVAVTFLKFYEGLPAKYNGPNPSKRPTPPPPQFKPPRDPKIPPERVAEFKKRFEARLAETVPVNNARIGSMDIGGPYEQVKGPSSESQKKIYVCGHLDGHHKAGCPRQIVANLARRAYRRPVSPKEVNQLLSLYQTARKSGDSFDEGITLAIQAMLVSPHFLFRIERDEPILTPASNTNLATNTAASAHFISQHELASRLSYFLWSSMPDDELLHCADQKILSKPDVLAAQVRRMLKDPKVEALVENFAGQWLELRKLDSIKPDRERFPDFEDYLRMSMRQETEMFFDSIVRDDRSILDFIDGKYTYLNERLANFYKIQGVSGPEFRKVDLLATAHRSGILTQASVLTVSSYATRTSPVLRGKWILENLLNAPPPPPPPDVPNLDEAKVGQTVSLRQQLEQHRKNAVCASCHSRMDPLGFGLENFDATGAWRTHDGKFPVDTSGVLPDGRKFNGPDELKVILKSDRDAFAKGLTEKLMTYALGRGLEPYDKRTVKDIVAHLSKEDYRFSALVVEIVNSPAFEMRRGEQAK